MDITQLPQLPIDWGTRNARHQRLLARETHKRGSRPTALALHESAWPWLLQSHNQKFTRHYSHFSELCLLCLVGLGTGMLLKKTDLGEPRPLPQKVQMTVTRLWFRKQNPPFGSNLCGRLPQPGLIGICLLLLSVCRGFFSFPVPNWKCAHLPVRMSCQTGPRHNANSMLWYIWRTWNGQVKHWEEPIFYLRHHRRHHQSSVINDFQWSIFTISLTPRTPCTTSVLTPPGEWNT